MAENTNNPSLAQACEPGLTTQERTDRFWLQCVNSLYIHSNQRNELAAVIRAAEVSARKKALEEAAKATCRLCRRDFVATKSDRYDDLYYHHAYHPSFPCDAGFIWKMLEPERHGEEDTKNDTTKIE